MYQFQSKHGATLSINHESKVIIIEYDGIKSQNLYGKTFATQERSNHTEFYISANKVENIAKYVDNNGNPVKNYVFSLNDEERDACVDMLKPIKSEKSKSGQARSITTSESAKIRKMASLIGALAEMEGGIEKVAIEIFSLAKTMADEHKDKDCTKFFKSATATMTASMIARAEEMEATERAEKAKKAEAQAIASEMTADDFIAFKAWREAQAKAQTK